MKHLRVRLAEMSDVETLLALERENKDYYFQSNVPPKDFPEDMSLARIKSKISHINDINGIYVVETTEKNIVASCSFFFTFHRNGFTFLKFNIFDNIRDAVGVDALKILINLCFQELNFNKLNVYVRSSKIAAMDVFLKCGFKVEVCSREHFYSKGKYENVYHLGLTKRDYLDGSVYMDNLLIKDYRSVDEDYSLVSNVSPAKQILIGNKIDLSLITSEDAEQIYQESLKSDDKNYASIAAAAPTNLDSILEYSEKENDLCFLNERISFGIKKKDGQIIGTIDADTIDHRNRSLMIGVAIYNPSERGRGYGREAIELFTDFAFLELNMHRVYFGYFAFNNDAGKLYEKIGFKIEGVNREFVYRNGKYYNENVMGILKKEWFTLRNYI